MTAFAGGAGQATPRPFPSAPRVDWPLLALTALMMGSGLLMVQSASGLLADRDFGDQNHYVWRQFVGLVGGGLAGASLFVVPWSLMGRFVWPLYTASLVLLVAVMSALGHSAKGATRWLDLGPINFQPSELAKVAVIVALAWLLAANKGRISNLLDGVVPALMVVALPVSLIVLQKDFGTTVILLGLTGGLLVVAGLRLAWLVPLGVAGAVGLVAMIVSEPYRIERLKTFADPFRDEAGSGYQIVQGWIALASGGWWGSGVSRGVAQRGFLPEPHTDFISAVITEELGVIGWLAVVVAQALLIARIFEVGIRARDLFGLLLCTGVGMLFASQALINLGVVAGLMPAKGLVLPFFSYGASAALVDAFAVGLVLRVSAESTSLSGGSVVPQ